MNMVMHLQKYIFKIVKNRQSHQSDDEEKADLLIDHLKFHGDRVAFDAFDHAKDDLSAVHHGDRKQVHDEKHQGNAGNQDQEILELLGRAVVHHAHDGDRSGHAVLKGYLGDDQIADAAQYGAGAVQREGHGILQGVQKAQLLIGGFFFQGADPDGHVVPGEDPGHGDRMGLVLPLDDDLEGVGFRVADKIGQFAPIDRLFAVDAQDLVPVLKARIAGRLAHGRFADDGLGLVRNAPIEGRDGKIGRLELGFKSPSGAVDRQDRRFPGGG